MKPSKLAPLGAAAILLAGLSLAQAQLAERELVEVEDRSQVVQHLDLTVEQIESMTVADREGASVGDVDAVRMTEDGEVFAVLVDVGGFLGMADRTAVLDLATLRVEQDRLVTDLGRQEIEALPHIFERTTR